MKNYKVKTIVLKDFNDIKDNLKHYEKDEPITLERARYEELLAKGYVEEGKIIEDKSKVSYEKEEE